MSTYVRNAFMQYLEQRLPNFSADSEEYHAIVRGLDCYILENNMGRLEKYRTGNFDKYETLVNMELIIFESMSELDLQTFFAGYCERAKVEAISYEALRHAKARKEHDILINTAQYQEVLSRFFDSTTKIANNPHHKDWLDDITDITVDDLQYAHGIKQYPSRRLNI